MDGLLQGERWVYGMVGHGLLRLGLTVCGNGILKKDTWNDCHGHRRA